MLLFFDKSAQRYRTADGRFVGRLTIIQARDSIVKEVSKQITSLTTQLRDGVIDVSDWQTGMRDAIRAGHTLSAGIVFGGKKNATPRDWGKLGVTLREQYKYLQRFAIEIEQGGALSLGRARMYANAIRTSFHNLERIQQQQAGRTRVIWHVTGGESCAGCLAAAGEWPISEVPRIGENICGSNCRCYYEYA